MTPIREMAEGDEASLVSLWVAAWRAAMPEIDFHARRAWLHERLDVIRRSGASVLLAGGADPVGFVTVDGSGFIDQLAVHPDSRKRGVARSLLDAALARHPGGLRLVVNSGNAAAVRLYIRYGFAIAGHGVNPLSGLPVIDMVFEPPRR